jgi:hypothetical protein
MGNAMWDSETAGLISTSRPTLLDLVSLKTEDPFKKHGMSRTNKGSNSTNSTLLARNASTKHTEAKSTSLPHLRLLEKVDESLKCSFTSSTKNATWDNNIVITASITYSSPSSDDLFCDFIVQSSSEKPRKQVDIQRISSSDLASLKETDAFMYYSIPSVRGAEWRDEDVNLTAIKDEALTYKIPSTYARKSCVSVESCHFPHLEIAEFDAMKINGLSSNMEIDDGEVSSEDDWLVSFSEMNQ